MATTVECPVCGHQVDPDNAPASDTEGTSGTPAAELLAYSVALPPVTPRMVPET